MQTLDCVSSLYNCLEFSQPPLAFRRGYVNTEKVLFCLNVLFLFESFDARFQFSLMFFCKAIRLQYEANMHACYK